MSKYVKIDKKELNQLKINASEYLKEYMRYEKQYTQERVNVLKLLGEYRFFEFNYNKAKGKKEKTEAVKKLFDFMELNQDFFYANVKKDYLEG